MDHSLDRSPQPRTYGLDLVRELEEQQDTDWVFGATSKPCLALIPEDQREQYLPQGEVQRGREDFQDCATRSPMNKFEAKFTYLVNEKILPPEDIQWLKDEGFYKFGRCEFSDAFIAILSGTTRQGNSLKAPLQAIHTNGLIPKWMLPADPNMTWAEYHSSKRITPAMRKLGKRFLSRFGLNYERVLAQHFNEVIKQDMIGVAGFAWPNPKKGIYPRDERQPNHAFVYFRGKHDIFDNYLDDGKKGDFIKRLAPDFTFMDYGYRVIISRNEVAIDRSIVDQLVEALHDGLIARVFAIIRKLGSWIGFAR